MPYKLTVSQINPSTMKRTWGVKNVLLFPDDQVGEMALDLVALILGKINPEVTTLL